MLFLQCFYALFGSILFSLKSDPFASDSVSFTDVSLIVLSNLRKFLLAKSLPPRPNAKPNAKANPLNVIINAELTIVLAIPKIGKHTSELQSRGHLVCRLLL